MVFNFSESLADQEKALQKAIDLLKQGDNQWGFLDCHKRMMNNKIDVTAFLAWFVENYPRSEKILREDPDYQLNFK